MPTEIALYGGEVQVKFVEKPYHRYYVDDPEYGAKRQYVRGVTTYLGIKDKSIGLVTWATELAGLHLLDIIAAGKPILSEDIIEAVNLHKERKEAAADLGTLIHAWCEYFIKHKLKQKGYEKKPELPNKETEKAIYLGAVSFLEWVTTHNVEFVASEQIVYHRGERYIGTADIIARVNGKLAVVDLKSSNGLYNPVRAQTAAYAKAYEAERPEEQVLERWAIRLSKEDEDEYYKRQERSCYIRGKSTNFIPEYQPVEWMCFPGREELESDYQAFLDSKRLFLWDAETDFFKAKNKQAALV